MFSSASFSQRSFSPRSFKFSVELALPGGGVGGGRRSSVYVPWYRDKPQEVDRRAQLQEEDEIAVALIQAIYAAGFFD
jgi:hypothetical protein